ncbi:MAG: hypothetical protein DRR42_12190 [Gammaproteobacteria bacterium]|nr:MAG: hypothetical protein DRR42_12190 [Gammaproteobacteria bacterium]
MEVAFKNNIEHAQGENIVVYIRSFIGFVLIQALVSCSTVEPELVNKDTTSAEGLRYWGSRPYLIVDRPYPISSQSVLIDGVVSADGGSLLVSGNTRNSVQFDHYIDDKTKTVSLLPVLKLKQSVGGGGLQAQSGKEEEGADNEPKLGTGDKKKSEAEEKSENSIPTETTKDTDKSTVGDKRFGLSTVTVSTDNTAQPIFKLNEYVSVTYMQDYAREYRISTKAKFGIKNVDITYGPGNTLVAMNASVDNSALVQPVVDAWSAVASAGSSALVAAINPGGAAMIAAQSGALGLEPAPEKFRGQRVTFRLHIVKFAVPGAYPFVREEELKFYATPAAGWDASVVRPYAPGQVPYRFFELLIAEPMFVAKPLSQLLDVEEEPEKQEGKEAEKNPCKAAQLLPKPNATKSALKAFFEGSVKAEILEKPKTNEGQCVEDLELKLKLKPAVEGAQEIQASKTAVEAEIGALMRAANSTNTKVNIVWVDDE